MVPITILDLDDEDSPKQGMWTGSLFLENTVSKSELYFSFLFFSFLFSFFIFDDLVVESEKKKTGPRNDANEERKLGKNNVSAKKTDVACSDASLPCMDLLKEELSCAVRIINYVLRLFLSK